MDQFWFMVKAVWEEKEVTNDNIKKETLVSALHDRTLTWYIKHSNDNPNATIADVQATLNKEFSRPKSETLSTIEFKEITILPGETPRELS